MKTQQKVRSKRAATKKSATAKKRNRSNGALTTQQIKDRTIYDDNEDSVAVLFQRKIASVGNVEYAEIQALGLTTAQSRQT